MLTEDEYNALVKDVKAYIIDGVLYDTLSVVVDILQHDWGKLAKKDTRMKVFGDLYKAKLDKQCKSHSTDSHEMLIAAGIVERLSRLQQNDFTKFVVQAFEDLSKMFAEKNEQYATGDPVANFRTGACLRYGSACNAHMVRRQLKIMLVSILLTYTTTMYMGPR